MNDVVAVDSMVLEALSFVELTCQVHIECRLSELLQHKIIVRCLLVEKRLEHGSIRNDVRKFDHSSRTVGVLVKRLKQLDQHQSRLHNAVVRVALDFVIAIVDLLRMLNELLVLESGVVSFQDQT